MKKLVALMTSLLLLFSAAPAALAAEETGEALNPYTISALDAVISLPSNIHVTDEQETENNIVLTMSLDGRQDCGLSLTISYNEAYTDYFASTLPDDMREELTAYYNQKYTTDDGSDAVTLISMEEADDSFSSFYVYGKGQDGNTYAIYVYLNGGFIMTSALGTSSPMDEEAITAIYNLFWQSFDMLMEAGSAA